MKRTLLVIAETTYSDDEGPQDEIRTIADALVGVGGIHTLHVAINESADGVLDVLRQGPHP